MIHLPATLHLEVLLRRDGDEARERVVLGKRSGESARHILLKLLGWILFFAPDLRIEQGVEQRHKPDLVRVDEEGRPLLWIDCGSIGVKRLDWILRHNRQAEVVVIKETEREAEAYLRSARPFLRSAGRLQVLGFRPGFVGELGEALHDRARVEASVAATGDRLEVEVEGGRIESPVAVLRPR